MRNPGIEDFSSISNYILKGIHIEENPSKNEKSQELRISLQFLIKF